MTHGHHFDIEEQLIGSLRERNGVATAGDIVADTGLSTDEVERGLRRMLGIYKSHLDVDDAGNLKYRFDPSFVRRGDEPGRIWFKLLRALRRTAALLFKFWIVLMLVGYTAAFVMLMLAAGLGMLGLTLAAGDDGGGGLAELGFLPIYAMLRVLEFMFWISLLDGRSGSGFFGRRMKRRKSRPEKPFYQKVFDFVFGPAESRNRAQESQRFFATLLRSHGGVLTSAEWSKYTGHSLSRARELLTACALRFRGAVEMADDGTLLFRFDELKVSADAGGGELQQPSEIWQQEYRPVPLTGNKRSTNVWVSILNGFNLSVAGLLLFGLPAAAGATTIAALGWIPLSFSALLFGIPLSRRLRQGKRKKRAERENRWRALLSEVYSAAEQNRALRAQQVPADLQARLMSEMAAESETDPEGNLFFRFPELERELAAAAQLRSTIAGSGNGFGRSVFSTEDDLSEMDEKDRAEFEERFQRELAR